MMPEQQAMTTEVRTSSRPFPWYCPKCRNKEVRPALISYRCDMAHDGQLHSVEVPQLTVPRCGHCGELVFNDDAEAQIRRVLRKQLHLLTPEEIRTARLGLGLSEKDLADRLGVGEAAISRWETETQIQSRALDNLLRVFFAFPEVRSVLLGANQDPHLGSDAKFGRRNGCMSYVTCVFCGTTAPESIFCPACGKAIKKWCPGCGEWKAPSFSSLEVDDGIVLAESQEEAKFCPDCGAELQAKSKAHE
jgi:putative zinc finger/helix-turn-helix YgiT family protein